MTRMALLRTVGTIAVALALIALWQLCANAGLISPVFFPGQVRNVTVYQKSAFWVWNMRSEIEVYRGVKLFGMVNNILDVNQSPIFIALDQNPCGANLAAQNGSCGNSMPGRELVIGFQARF